MMELIHKHISVVVCGIKRMPFLFLKHLIGFNQPDRNLNIKHLKQVLQSEQTLIMFIFLST